MWQPEEILVISSKPHFLFHNKFHKKTFSKFKNKVKNDLYIYIYKRKKEKQTKVYLCCNYCFTDPMTQRILAMLS